MSEPINHLGAVIAVAIYLVGSTVAAVWWAGTTNAKLTALIEDKQETRALVDDLQKLVRQNATTAVVLQTVVDRIEDEQRRNIRLP